MNRKIAALAASVALAPLAAVAAPITSYPAATTPLSGSETVIGTQSATTVQITTASIAAIVTGGAQTFTGVATFPAPGASKGSIVLTPGTVSGTPPNGAIWTSSAGLFAEIAGVTHQFADLDGNTYTGPELLAAATTGAAGLNVGQGVAPTSPNNGDVWATTAALFVRLNGATQQEAVLGLAQTFTAAQTFNGTVTIKDAGATQNILLTGVSGSTPTVTIGNGTNNGVLLFPNSTGISRDSNGVLDVGNGTFQDKSGAINLGTLNASSGIATPDVVTASCCAWGLRAGFNRISAPFEMSNIGTSPQTAPSLNNALTIMTLGDPNHASVEITGTPDFNATIGTFYTEWGMCLNATDGFELLCTEPSGDGENHFITIGMNRFSAGGNGTTIPNGVAGMIFEDFIVNSTQISALSGGLGGSGITSAPTVSFSGGCNAQAATAINNGAIIGYSVYNPGLNGLCNGTTATLGGGGVGAVLPTNPTVVNGSASTQAAPYEIFDWNGTGAFGAFGPDSSAINDPVPFRFGSSANFGSPGVWDNRPGSALNWGFAGGVAFGTGTGTTNANGVMNWNELLKDDNSGHLALTAVGGGSTVGLKAGFITLGATTVSGLATQDPSPTVGDRATVTDATSCSFNGAVTGGGSTKCGVIYTGSWVGG